MSHTTRNSRVGFPIKAGEVVFPVIRGLSPLTILPSIFMHLAKNGIFTVVLLCLICI
jgi:hypothetical protein